MRKLRKPRFRALLAALIAIAISLAAAISGCDLPPIYEYWDSIVLYELEISPSFIALQEGQKATFSVIGGKVPYSFELSGDGFISPLAGHKVEYTAPIGSAEAWIGVRDIYDASSLARVMVVEDSVSQLAIAPAIVSLDYDEQIAFDIIGGKPPFSFHLIEGLGTVDEASGLYTAPSTNTNAVVRLEDGSGQLSDAVISVRLGWQPLTIVPATIVLEKDESFPFNATGGVSPYIFSLASGVGSVNISGEYSSSTLGDAIVSVTDSNVPFASAEATITIVAVAPTTLVIIPRSIDIKMGSSFQFSAEGGVPFADPDHPYIFEMVSSYGGIIDASGIYTAPDTRQGVEQLRAIDSRGISDTATVKVKKK